MASSLQALPGVFPGSLGGLYPLTPIGRSVFTQPNDLRPLGGEVFVNEAVCARARAVFTWALSLRQPL